MHSVVGSTVRLEVVNEDRRLFRKQPGQKTLLTKQNKQDNWQGGPLSIL